MTRYILDVVDLNNDFMRKNGALYVPDAESIIESIQKFLNNVVPGTFDFALVKYDTHFSGEYPFSPESFPFPNIHCEFDTWGWQQAVDFGRLAQHTPVYYLAKNTFNMWDNNPVGKEKQITFKSEKEKTAYTNLFNVTADPECLIQGIPREQFMEQNKVGPGTTVVLLGVASNFCDFDAMLGYLKRGANVVVLDDLVRGIPHGPDGQAFHLKTFGIDRTATGLMSDVLKTKHFAPYVESGQLKLMTSYEFLVSTKKPDLKGPQP